MTDMNRMTQKSLEAIRRAQSIAVEYQHMQIDQEHVAVALTESGDGLIPQLLEKAGVTKEALRQANEALRERFLPPGN